jgi:two-component system, chemotaxis family, CheB/CheR fusion protein
MPESTEALGNASLADESGLSELLHYLSRTRGFDFSAYKRSSLGRRIVRRMQTLGLEHYTDYVDYLEVHPDEFAQLFNTILINVTDFFRDPPAWDVIGTDVIPRIMAARLPSEQIRVWSAGCASGQEAYSVAMLLADALGDETFRQRVKIYATDLDEDALQEARQGSYSLSQIANVPGDFRGRYFEQSNGRYLFRKDLRRAVIFGRHDLLRDAPISRVDLLICRNTIMYFNAEAQSAILNRFEFALNNGGFIFLGKAEVLLARSPTFVPLDVKCRIFVKLRKGRSLGSLPEAMFTRYEVPPEQQRLRELAHEAHPVAHLVVSVDGVMVMANAKARQLLALTREHIGRSVSDLQLYRPLDLTDLLLHATTEQRAMHLKEVDWTLPGGDKRFVDVTSIPLLDADQNPLGILVVFTDVSRYRRLEEELQVSHQELEMTNTELQSSNEELETTNEELQSTVEELETTNEELQSTNEELETMNEEIQSTNEELEAANEELRRRGLALNEVNAFLEGILAGLADGVVVVDSQMLVRAWNHRSEDLWGLRADEVRGRHFLSLDIGLPVDRLRPMIRDQLGDGSALDGGQPNEMVLAATNRRGRAITVRVLASRFNSPSKIAQGVILVVREIGEAEKRSDGA